MSFLGPEFWGWYRSTFETCAKSIEWVYFYNLVVNSLHVIIYSCLIALNLTTFYYLILKPDDEEDFNRKWLPRAKSVAIILVCMVIATICLLCLFNILVGTFIQITMDHTCDQQLPHNFNRYSLTQDIGVIFYALAFLYAVLVMS